MKPLQIVWTQHLKDPARKKDFENTLRNSTLVLDRMYDILTEMERAILSEELGKEQYQTPAWNVLQGHRNGNREMIKKLKDLIGFYK